MAKSSALVSSKLERSAMAKSLLVWTVMGEDRVSGFSSLGFFGTSTPSVMSDFILSAGLFSPSFFTFSVVRTLPLLLPEGRLDDVLGSCLTETVFVLEILGGSTSF